MARPSPSTYPCCRSSLDTGAHPASGNETSTAIRRAGWLCCACAATGQAAAPPMSPMTSRRLMRSALQGSPFSTFPSASATRALHITAIFLALPVLQPVPQLKGQWFLYSLNSAPAGNVASIISTGVQREALSLSAPPFGRARRIALSETSTSGVPVFLVFEARFLFHLSILPARFSLAGPDRAMTRHH